MEINVEYLKTLKINLQTDLESTQKIHHIAAVFTIARKRLDVHRQLNR